ncbi:MAG: pyridoxamine 5'-phosphate oxidase [Pseudomonadota bacterium]
MNANLDDAALKSEQAPDPFDVFDAWFQEAIQSEINDPNAMTLATADATGMPDARTVLLKGHDARGFVFYTNLESAKGGALAQNPRAALLFHWKTLRRQVRVRGPASAVESAEADDYYNSRPLQSRIGAWASDQSRPAADRAELERRVSERSAEFGDHPPRPPHWSGFRVTPLAMEFWQDGAFRLHDRFLYSRPSPDAPWTVTRLYP